MILGKRLACMGAFVVYGDILLDGRFFIDVSCLGADDGLGCGVARE